MNGGVLSALQNSETDVVLYVVDWLYSEPIDEQFIIYPKSGWLLWNYFRRVGVRALVTKVLSRLAERQRNNKIAGIGTGVVVQSSLNSAVDHGEIVLFFAPNHNPRSQFIVANQGFVLQLLSEEEVSQVKISQLPQSLRVASAWTPFSGFPVDFSSIQASLQQIARNTSRNEVKLPVSLPKPVDCVEVPIPHSRKPSAVLFGLGNYAKTAIIPNIKRDLRLQRVHEVDPDQFRFLKNGDSICFDTSPIPRPGQSYDAWFIAGYHHTHADLAVREICQNATAVIEKPLATTREQYDAFKSVLERNPGHRFYLCYHKRYSELHAFFERDLGQNKGSPVDMHCVV